jgi:hypothetical protein
MSGRPEPVAQEGAKGSLSAAAEEVVAEMGAACCFCFRMASYAYFATSRSALARALRGCNSPPVFSQLL